VCWTKVKVIGYFCPFCGHIIHMSNEGELFDIWFQYMTTKTLMVSCICFTTMHAKTSGIIFNFFPFIYAFFSTPQGPQYMLAMMMNVCYKARGWWFNMLVRRRFLHIVDQYDRRWLQRSTKTVESKWGTFFLCWFCNPTSFEDC
jgi:hypothetical protein